ncbi:DUF397 domain-containing protein [Micromonospora sp. NBC_01796]|uniref:DUF397 domain-containing protein n=1 Tax=Micromonospora sp. NBC_01796 TaxID=2975987 RepID=UPI002DDBBEED|nr:DUF397 domain-containing protein [Micromonospora sp. NBC_01796]WSA89571.1 DUF397 domain-containing protein [Micromonospora sp. NBC_01796]
MNTPDFSGATWRKSRRSDSNGGQCVEVAVRSGAVGLRDSKDPAGPVLVFTPDCWTTFVGAVRRTAFQG